MAAAGDTFTGTESGVQVDSSVAHQVTAPIKAVPCRYV